MLSLFRKKKPPAIETIKVEESPLIASGFLMPQKAHQLLDTSRRQKLLAHIWQRTSISRNTFASLYVKPIERYAELVQQFPASESHHHSYPGGMLDHGLEIVAYALKLRQSYLLPIGSSPEEQSAQSEVWTAGIAYAALLHDIGKIAVDLYVEYEDSQVWHPWHGTLKQPYRFQYRKDREFRLHSASTGLLYHQILDVSILDWLCQTQELWAAFLYVLAGQFEHAGVLGEIVTRADQASVAQELGGDPVKVMAAPKHALQRKLLDGLRYLIKEELKLNNSGPSDGWVTDDALWLVSKTVSDKLRAHLLSRGVSGIPEKNSAIFDVLQEHSIILPTQEGKAIWNATVSSASGWKNHFTFLKVAPALIWGSDERPVAFAGSVIVDNEAETMNAVEEDKTEAKADLSVNSTVTTPAITGHPETQIKVDGLDAVFDLLGIESIPDPVEQPLSTNENETTAVPDQPIPKKIPVIASKPVTKKTPETGITQIPDFNTSIVTDDLPSGERFMSWLKEAILNRKLIMNDAQALVHTLNDTLFLVTPGIFKRYVLEFPATQQLAKEANLPEWQWAQRQFEHLKLHQKRPDGLNIWNCTVRGPRKTRHVNGYLLADSSIILPEIPFNNPYLSIKNDADSHKMPL